MTKNPWTSLLLALIAFLALMGPTAGAEKSDNIMVVGDLFDIAGSNLDPAQESSGLLADKAQIVGDAGGRKRGHVSHPQARPILEPDR